MHRRPHLAVRRLSALTRSTLARAGNRRLAIIAGVLGAVVAAPIALAGPIQGGQRNPTNGTNYTNQTEIIASNNNWGTRQSNKGTGGGAIYGCRSTTGRNPCIEGDNLNNGKAFAFVTGGSIGGSITLSNTSGAPLTTNATGVATGFNANFLQGKQASNFLGATAQAVDSAKLGGVPATSYAQTSQLSSYAQGQLLFADVSTNGTLGNNRSATASAQTSSTSTPSYTVTFNTDVSKCSYTASPVGAPLTSGSIGVAPDTTNKNVVDVNSPGTLPQGFHLQVIC